MAHIGCKEGGEVGIGALRIGLWALTRLLKSLLLAPYRPWEFAQGLPTHQPVW